MSVKDARISTAFPTHPKTKKLMRRLGPGGALACVYLFLWAAANRSDGDLSGLSDEDIELAVDWAGEPGAFVTAAAEVGYLDGEEGERTIHDWHEHNPWAAGADLRSDRARWANLIRHHGPEEASRLMPEYAARIGRASFNDPKPSLPAPSRSEDGEIRTPPLPLPSPYQEQKPEACPKAAPSDSPRDDIAKAKAERLASVTEDAIETFNAQPFTVAHGGRVPNVTTVNREKRRQQVGRAVKVIREICEAELGSQTITRQFWEAYWQIVNADPFASGRQPGTGAHANWKPDFEYLTRPDTVTRLYERAEAA